MVELLSTYRKITKVGTGMCVFLPPHFLKSLGVDENDMVEVVLTDDERIIIKRIER